MLTFLRGLVTNIFSESSMDLVDFSFATSTVELFTELPYMEELFFGLGVMLAVVVLLFILKIMSKK